MRGELYMFMMFHGIQFNILYLSCLVSNGIQLFDSNIETRKNTHLIWLAYVDDLLK